MNTLSSKADLGEAQLEPESPISTKKASSSDHQAFDQKHLQLQHQQQQQIHQEMASDTSRTTGPSSQNQSAGKAPLEKVLKLQCLTVNLPVLSLFSISPKLGKKLVSFLLLLLFLFCCLSFSLPLEHIFIYNSTDPNNSQKINKVQSFPDF